MPLRDRLQRAISGLDSGYAASASIMGQPPGFPASHRPMSSRSVFPTRLRSAMRRSTAASFAVATLFIPELLGVSAQVESACPATGERVALTVHPDRIEPHGKRPPVSLLAPDPEKAAADIVGHFCCHVQFFAAERAGNEWVAKPPGTLLATLDQAWQLGRRHNAQRYPMLRI